MYLGIQSNLDFFEHAVPDNRLQITTCNREESLLDGRILQAQMSIRDQYLEEITQRFRKRQSAQGAHYSILL